MDTRGYDEDLLNLWGAVIDQARRDLEWSPSEMKNQSLYRLKCNARMTAKWWLGTEDFYEVCELANVSPDSILTELRRL